MVSNREARVVPTDEYISTTIDGEEVILHMESGIYFGVDGVGARIWDLAASEPTVSDIEATIHEEFDVERDRVESDVQTFLSELESAGLVTLVDDG